MRKIINLPSEFLERIKSYAKDEFDDFLTAYSLPHKRGIRINTLKTTSEKVGEKINISFSPFSPLSFYIDDEIAIGKHPYHAAGAFYVQEPSASSAVTVLAPEPGDKVLDMCAAPGGKSTQIAALINDQGLLWSNEIVKSRANILVSNIERMGLKNAVISSCSPQVIANELKGFFDKILVDAPCSGEGMFRRNPEAILEWSQEHVASCAQRQLAILTSAAECLKEDGVMVYSTCTFSYEENEGVILEFLKTNPDFVLEPIEVNFGRPAMDMSALRIFPMDGGEGHFVAKLKKLRGENTFTLPYEANVREAKFCEDIYFQLFNSEPQGVFEKRNDKILLLPKLLPKTRKIPILRAGVIIAELKGKHFEPHHSAFMAHKPNECLSTAELDENTVMLYLSGNEIDCGSQKGFTAAVYDNMVLGFGKASNGRLKNKYPKGLRI